MCLRVCACRMATWRIKRPLTPCVSTHVCYRDAAILVSARVNGKQLPCITVSVVFHSPCVCVEPDPDPRKDRLLTCDPGQTACLSLLVVLSPS